VRILLAAWQEGGRIPADVDIDALGDEMEANLSADAMQRRLENALNSGDPAASDDPEGPDDGE
jgi:hypothetical protein